LQKGIATGQYDKYKTDQVSITSSTGFKQDGVTKKTTIALDRNKYFIDGDNYVINEVLPFAKSPTVKPSVTVKYGKGAGK
jgi:hypothetical protein